MNKLHIKHIFFSATLFILCLAATAYAKKSTPPKDPILLGMSAAFTGHSRGLGIELFRGSQAYFNQVNANGGINGRKVVIKYYDDGYDPLPAIRNTINLIEKDNVLCLFNYVGTPTVTRVLPVIKHFNTDKPLYMFFPFTGAQPQREFPYEEYVFNLRTSYRQETWGLVHNLFMVGRRRIAVLYQADAYGRSGWDGVRKALTEKDLRIVAEATYRRGIDFKSSMEKQVKILAAAQPDAIISIGTYEACAAFIRDARDAGLNIPICNLSFVGSENMLQLLNSLERSSGKNYTEDLINTQAVPTYEDTSLAAVRDYRKVMSENPPAPPEEFSKDYNPLKFSFISFEGYLNAKVMSVILTRMMESQKNQSLYSATLSIRDLDIGLDEPISFGRGKHQGLDEVYYTTVSGGQFIPLTNWNRWSK
ncbi:ABC transporter substrate-binding protein [Desulfovibrio gilichinskyi]|uniref:Amino acid/amide ABC transporter substrate-binding protein, HAAT family n=1 Tax=Desulfovibrio gilichinskyi TaxID=1519643 RepID=A0A1X7D1J0_9BACT|nr:ABC transporter substrate-binding protein [Desulfovibrio gilichinskyi]SMF07013.1 amino acid/amide ABC transporter substrate-binding protein, HAAT family [Desulfovibrio gilichinskyi]